MTVVDKKIAYYIEGVVVLHMSRWLHMSRIWPYGLGTRIHATLDLCVSYEATIQG